MALLRADSLHLAWLGDCRSVLCRGGKALELTVDHVLSEGATGGAGEDTERARVLREGGQIEAGRLSGFLEVARAFGDVDYLTGRKPVGLSGLPELRSQRHVPHGETPRPGSGRAGHLRLEAPSPLRTVAPQAPGQLRPLGPRCAGLGPL